jgi:hypothetical protein
LRGTPIAPVKKVCHPLDETLDSLLLDTRDGIILEEGDERYLLCLLPFCFVGDRHIHRAMEVFPDLQ